jgi:hypothetical protein
MPAKVVAWFREGGAVDEGLCAQNPALWNVTACDHGYRQIAPLGNAHTTPDCMVNGTDTTLDDEIACFAQYIPAMEADFPGLPWIITIDERGRQADQYALYPWCKDRWCAVTGSDEWCDASASRANVKAQVDAYHAETLAAYGHPLPVIGVLGPQGITESWCDGWTEWDIVAPELYALPPTTPDQMENAWNQAVAMIPASQTVGACLQAYSRNGSIPDPQQMASYPARGWQVAARNGRVRFVIPFSGWRVYGTQYHRPTLGPVARWGVACYLAGTDCANPPIPPPAATPAPTPKPTPIVGPGTVLTPSVNVVFPAGTTTVNVDVGRKDGTTGEIVLSYSVTCDSTGDDCTGGNVPAGALTFPDGSVGATMSFPVPPQTQPGQRVWLVRLLSVSNGGQIDSGPGPSHFHVTVAPEATDASVNFWLSSGLTIPGNPWGVILTRGDCRQPASGSWCLEPGSTLVDGVDYDYGGVRCGSLGAHPAWSMDAGVCQFFTSFPTTYGAVSGHAGVLTLLPDDPTRRVGKMKVSVQ